MDGLPSLGWGDTLHRGNILHFHPQHIPVSYTHLDVYKRQALLSPGGAAPSGKKLLMLTVYNVFRRLLGSSGVFLPEVLPGKEMCIRDRFHTAAVY